MFVVTNPEAFNPKFSTQTIVAVDRVAGTATLDDGTQVPLNSWDDSGIHPVIGTKLQVIPNNY